MYFGEFLVQQKVLSAHQILKALDEQRKRRHYIPLLMVDQGALPDHRVLRMCTQADEHHEDFLDVLVHEGLLNEQQSKRIRAAWIRSGPPIGRLLVDLGSMNEETLRESLEEFEASKTFENVTSAFAEI